MMDWILWIVMIGGITAVVAGGLRMIWIRAHSSADQSAAVVIAGAFIAAIAAMGTMSESLYLQVLALILSVALAALFVWATRPLRAGYMKQ